MAVVAILDVIFV